MISRKQVKSKKENFKTENIECLKCKQKFGVDVDYIGVITCPYCGEYVEG